MTTSQYIYRALFQEGQNNDVTLIALGKEWKLHKVYLCQVSLTIVKYEKLVLTFIF